MRTTTDPATTTSASSPSRSSARLAGLSYIVASVGFLVVFSWLAAAFGYPDVLDHDAAEVLPALLTLGATGRAVWIVYAILPLLLIPAGLGAMDRFRGADRVAPASARLGMVLQVIAALAMLMGLARWSTANWVLAEAWGGADAATRAAITVMFDAFNAYLGNALGEFVGEMALYGSFLAFGRALQLDGSRRMAIFAGVTGVTGLIAMFRNMTTVVQPASDVSNLLLPLFLIGFGWFLLRSRPNREA